MNKPLGNFSVVDFGLGLAGGLVSHILRDLGAKVTRAEAQSGDPFYERYPAYGVWHRGKTFVKAATAEQAVISLHAELERADLCIIGGEDFPGYHWRPDTVALVKAYPKLVILELSGGPFGSTDAELPATDLLIQAQTGLVFEQFPDRPSVWAFPAGAYGAALQGLIAAFAALCEREESGQGQIARTSLFEGVLAWLSHDWYAFEQPTPVAQDITPKGVRPLIFRCADGKYLHIIFASTDARKHVFTVLGVENPVPSLDEDPRGMPSIERGAEKYYDDVDMLQTYVNRWQRDDLLKALWAKGVSTEAVNEPGDTWGDAQVKFNNLVIDEPDGISRIGLPFELTLNGNAAHAASAPPSAADRWSGDIPRPPLAGVKVVDFGTFTAGPHASLPLSDLGADVVKIETLSGDVLRFYYLKYTGSSRGKQVISVDMKAPEGKEIAMKLCLGADIVHHNFRPGVTKRLGIDVETLHRHKPELILLETAAYGIDGPKASNAGFDMIFHSYCGHSIQSVGRGRSPRNYRLPVIDFSAGMLGSIATMIAQYLKLQHGTGATITTSLLNSGLFLLSELIRNPQGEFAGLPALNENETGFHPAMRLYRTGEDWIAIAVPESAMAERFLNVLGLADAIVKPREDWGASEEALIESAIAARPAAELLYALSAADVWSALCRKDAKDRIFEEGIAQSLPIVVGTDDSAHGPFLQLGAQFSLSRSPLTIRGASPARGQDTRSILAELGYSSGQIADLYERQIVR